MSSLQEPHDFELVPSPSKEPINPPMQPLVAAHTSTGLPQQPPATSLSLSHDAKTYVLQTLAKILLLSTIPFSVAVTVVVAYSTGTETSKSQPQISEASPTPLRGPLDTKGIHTKQMADLETLKYSPTPSSDNDDNFLSLAATRAGNTIRAYRRPLRWIDVELSQWLTA